MAELLKSNRVFFPAGKQGEFLLQSKSSLHCTWGSLAELCQTSLRNLNSWRNENNSMSLYAVEQICKKRCTEIPRDIVIKDQYWYVKKGAVAGGKALIKKHGVVGGDEVYRKKKWREWWEKEGKFKPSKVTEALPFRKPTLSRDLAEFVGILLGDGGISEHQITVTLNSVTDKDYLEFVQKLIKKLFEISVGFYTHNQSLARRVVISRTALITFLTDRIGLKKGSKVRQQVDIPQWIKESRPYSIACIRGLIDTDGCIIIHQYLSKGKRYCYKKVSFANRSYPLIESVSNILSDIGIKHRIVNNKWDIRIEAKKDVEKYFQVVGTSNPKHWKRYKVA